MPTSPTPAADPETEGPTPDQPSGAAARRRAAAPRSTTKVLLLALVLGLVVGGPVAYYLLSAKDPSKEVIVIALQPTSAPQNISAKGTELEAFLEDRMAGVDVQIYIPTDSTLVVASLKSGQAQAAFMGAWPAVLAGRETGSEIVLAERREVTIGSNATVETFYYSYYVSMADRGYDDLNDARGQKACYTSKTSTSGYLFPLARLIQTGRIAAPQAGTAADPKGFFSEVTFAGSYQACWEALRQGHVDVGIIAGDVSRTLYDQVLAATDVLETNGPVPSHTVVFSKDFKDPLRTQLRDALLELGQPQHRALMRSLVSGIFVEFVVTDTQQHAAGLEQALVLTQL